MSFLKRIELLQREEGNELTNNSTKWLMNKFKKGDDTFKEIFPTKMEIGRFYFMFYDMQGKTSKMEQFSPILLVDYRKEGRHFMIYGISLNFLPLKVRILFFNALLSNFQHIFEPIDSKEKVGKKEKSIDIDFHQAFRMLDKIGFQYIIREFNAKLINKCFEVSMSNLDRFLTINTEPLTGVAENKMADIWLSKLKKREESYQERISKLVTDYAELNKMFNQDFNSYKREFENIQNSKDHLRNLGL